MTYKFKVTTVEQFLEIIEIEAPDLLTATEEAWKLVKETPIEYKKNTFDGTTTEIEPIPVIHSVEGLFNPDEEEEELVIKVNDLSKRQKVFLGL